MVKHHVREFGNEADTISGNKNIGQYIGKP